MYYIFCGIFLSFIVLNDAKLGPHQRYNLGIWSLDPGGETAILAQSFGYPAKHSNYVVTNLGKESLWAEIKYGTLLAWYGWIVGYMIEPGETRVLSNSDGRYYYTALRISNGGKKRAIFVARKQSGHPLILSKYNGYDESIDINEFAKFMMATIADNIPVVGATLSHVIEFFWPDTKTDVWSEIENKVSALVDSRVKDVIESLLNNNLRRLKKRIKSLARALSHGIKGENVTNHYMNIAQDLIGVEEAFRFTKKNNMDHNLMNYALLPIYSSVITMKLMYYRMAELSKEDLGMTEATLSKVKFYAKDLMLDGAFQHIYDVYAERLDNRYDNAHSENMFNAMVTTRTFCAINGLEFIPLWKNWINNPKSNSTPYRDTVTYSTYMGRPTIELQKVVQGGKMSPILLPEYVNKKIRGTNMEVRGTLRSVTVYYNSNHIQALSTIHEKTTHQMGFTGEKHETINFPGKYLKKLIAYGDDEVTGLSFYFSDKTVKDIGNVKSEYKFVFELSEHHIAGIFAGVDTETGRDIIVNIAVSYMLDNEYMI